MVSQSYYSLVAYSPHIPVCEEEERRKRKKRRRKKEKMDGRNGGRKEGSFSGEETIAAYRKLEVYFGAKARNRLRKLTKTVSQTKK